MKTQDKSDASHINSRRRSIATSEPPTPTLRKPLTKLDPQLNDDAISDAIADDDNYDDDDDIDRYGSF